MGSWHELDPSDIATLDATSIKNIPAIVGLAPSDVPDRIRISDNEGKRQYEFRYVTDDESDLEPTIPSADTSDIQFKIGRNSKRIYSIRMNVGKTARVTDLMFKTLEKTHPRSTKHYRTICRLIQRESTCDREQAASSPAVEN